MIDHLGLTVSDYEKLKAFYLKALAPLGIGLVMEFGKAGGFGVKGKPSFWIGEGGPSFWRAEHHAAGAPIHISFTASDRATVDAFYDAAIAAGATDFGPPGVRAHYHADYYGAFVLDPDGNNVEAVCHKPG